MSMKVTDLQPNTNATVRVRVCAQGQSRKVNSKKGYALTVCTFMVGDETATIEYSAFGKDVMAMGKNIGKVIDIKDGWVKEWNGKLQLSLGKSGMWEIVDDKEFPSVSDVYKNVPKETEEDNEEDEE